MHLIERKIVRREYASPGRARAAIGRSNLSKPAVKRLQELVQAWADEPTPRRGVIPPPRQPSNGEPTRPIVAGEAASSAPVRFESVRHAHQVLSQLAVDKRVDLVSLLDDVQAYELSIRKEVSRRELNGSLEHGFREQEVGPVIAGPDPS